MLCDVFIGSERTFLLPPSLPHRLGSPENFIAKQERPLILSPHTIGMVSRWMSRSPSPPPVDEPAVSDSQCHRDLPNTMPSFLNWFSWTSPSTLANIQDRRSPSIDRTRTDTSPNVNAAHSTLRVSADTSSTLRVTADTSSYCYPSNASTCPTYRDSYTESNVSFNGYSLHHRESTNLSIMDNMAWSQDHHPTTDSIRNESNELQSSLGYGGPIYNPPSYHGTKYHSTAQEGGDVSYPRTTVPGSNLSPQMQYLDNNTPYPPQYISPNADTSSSTHRGSSSGSCGQPSSSSYREPPSSSYGHISSSSHHGSSSNSYRQPFNSHRVSSSSSYLQPSSSSYRQPLSHHRKPSLYPESSVHDPEMYHGSQQRSEDFDIYGPQVAGTGFPEQPGPSTASLPSAATHSRSRQNIQRHRRSNTHRAHHSPSTIFSCGWLVGENTTCGFEGPLDAFKAHFMQSHPSGAQNAPNSCRWQGCDYRKRDNATIKVMRRDCLWRHVRETHLRVKRNA